MADFYGTEDGFSEYCERNGYTIPSGDQESALYRASIYIDNTYGARFTGVKTGGRDQQRAWPRNGAYDSEGWGYLATETPWQVDHATYEAALRELQSPGSLIPDVVPGQIIKSATIDVIQVEYAIGKADAKSQAPTVPIIDGILASLFGAAVNPYAGARSRG